MNIEVAPLPIPTEAEVNYSFSVRFQFNITPAVARQKVNTYLLMNVGNMLSGGEPTLLLGTVTCWKVPVFCAYPEFERRELLGDLAVNAETGEIDLDRSSFSSATAIGERADALHHTFAASAARA